jgi:uncharacterized protein (DUF2237 family)
MDESLNVFGEPLEPCSLKPLTGFHRDGSCNTGDHNQALHTVCIYATEAFLAYSKKVGNDLSTPMPQYDFAGVQPGQSWCLGGYAFLKAHLDGEAPKIFIHATHQRILDLIDLETLKRYAIDL